MIYDVLILGGGPAGLTAGIYAGRARLKTLVIESFTIPGQAIVTNDIENFPGFPEGVNGFDLIEKFRAQAKNAGTEFKTGEIRSVREIKDGGKLHWQVTVGEEELTAMAIIIATGAHPKELGILGEGKLRGKGVSYCAVCDAAFFKEKKICVIGGGNTAIEEALFLTKFAKGVTIIHRRDRLRATKILQERAFAEKKIDFLWESVVSEIKGAERVESVTVRNVKTEKDKNVRCDGVFIFAGYVPNTDIFKGVLKLDENGYIEADENMRTSKKGVFAAGDVRKKPLRQVVTACGDGATAAHSARLYVEDIKGVAYK